MILIDNQSGSKDLFPFIQALTPNCILTRIDPPFGDIVWMGNGPDGSMINVAVEYKKIDEILGAIGGDGRFGGHQVGGLIKHYGRRYLLVEGRIRTDRNTGILQKRRQDRWEDIYKQGRGFTYRDLQHWYTTIEEHAGFRVVETFDEFQSARWVWTKYTWWTAKEWDEHSALKVFHVPPPPVAGLFNRPNLVRRVAKEFSSIGWDRSIAVADKFKSVREMVNANESDWCSISGIGKTIARSICEEVNGKGGPTKA